ncbi:MAG: DUF3418 domain-containing protein, partial [Dietzia sp.]|nr:DUF3418 domain-containing protein [Dietzia sp.]
HLRMRFEVVDGDEVVAAGTDLGALRSRLVDKVRATLNSRLVPDDGPHRAWTADTIGDLSPSITGTVDGVEVTVYPALQVRPDGIHRIACATETERRAAQTTAVLTLISADLISAASIVRGRPVEQRLALTQYPHGGADGLVSDAALAACGRLIAGRRGEPVLTVHDFDELRARARSEAPAAITASISAALPALVAAQSVSARLDQVPRDLADDVRPALDFLVGKGFLARHPAEVLPQLERHVRAIDLRLDLAEKSPSRYRELAARLEKSEATVAEATAALRRRPGGARAARDLRWMLAEYRVGLFAQSLGTARPVSAERIEKAVAAALSRRNAR